MITSHRIEANLPSKIPPAAAVLGMQHGRCTRVVAWCEAPQLADDLSDDNKNKAFPSTPYHDSITMTCLAVGM